MGAPLRAALDFLHAHAGHVPLITIDIGGNDLDSCYTSTSATAARTCVKPLITSMNSQLTALLKALRATDPTAVIVGLNYYVQRGAGVRVDLDVRRPAKGGNVHANKKGYCHIAATIYGVLPAGIAK